MADDKARNEDAQEKDEETANGFLVLSTVSTPEPPGATRAGVRTETFYIGPFSDEEAAQGHADEHNKQAHTTAFVLTLVNPDNC